MRFMTWYAFGTRIIHISHLDGICAAFDDVISHVLLTFMFFFHKCKIDRITIISFYISWALELVGNGMGLDQKASFPNFSNH